MRTHPKIAALLKKRLTSQQRTAVEEADAAHKNSRAHSPSRTGPVPRGETIALAHAQLIIAGVPVIAGQDADVWLLRLARELAPQVDRPANTKGHWMNAFTDEQLLAGPHEPVSGPDHLAYLTAPGRPGKTVHINGRTLDVTATKLTYEEIVALAGKKGLPKVEYTHKLHGGPLLPGERVWVYGGMKLAVGGPLPRRVDTPAQEPVSDGELIDWLNRAQAHLDALRAAGMGMPEPLHMERGRRYYRITKGDGRIYAFVDRNGDVLMPATWRAPETKHPRGNIRDADGGTSWLGVHGVRTLEAQALYLQTT